VSVRIINADVMDGLAQLGDGSVHCVVTSPPYWGLRDYGVPGQLGLEPTLGEHIEAMVKVFREVRRVLRKDGTLWLNYGDSYAANGTKQSGRNDAGRNFTGGGGNKLGSGNPGQLGSIIADSGLKHKDLCGVPWRVAFALQADGWWLRQDIIWSKPNPMPESIKDRCTKAHEYLFLLAKSERYYFDADAICEETTKPPGSNGNFGNKNADARIRALTGNMAPGVEYLNKETRNKRSVWEIATQPFPEAHFATFPPALIEPCIKAGTSEKGCCVKCGAPWAREIARNDVDQSANEVIKTDGVPGLKSGTSADRVRKLSGSTYQHVRGGTIGWLPACKCGATTVPCTALDPFGGSGTTGLVADRLKRNAILIELNPEYAAMAEKRIRGDSPLFASVSV
jgi:DNA modification methylase